MFHFIVYSLGLIQFSVKAKVVSLSFFTTFYFSSGQSRNNTCLQELAQHQDESLALWQKNVSINLQISSNLSNKPAVRWFVVGVFCWVFFCSGFMRFFCLVVWGGQSFGLVFCCLFFGFCGFRSNKRNVLLSLSSPVTYFLKWQ